MPSSGWAARAGAATWPRPLPPRGRCWRPIRSSRNWRHCSRRPRCGSREGPHPPRARRLSHARVGGSAWLDLDGAGQPEIVLAGGSSPAPYYAVFERLGTSWRFLHDGPFRFLGAATHRGRLHLLSVFDGYGVDGPRLAVDTIDSTGRSKQHLVFSLMEWPTAATASAPVSECTTARTTALRSTAVRDDHPTDRGTETLASGNVFQTLAVGSTGWVLQTVRGEDGAPRSLCCFVGEAAAPLRPRRCAAERSRRPGACSWAGCGRAT